MTTVGLPTPTTDTGLANAARLAEIERRLAEQDRGNVVREFVFAKIVRDSTAGQQTVNVNTTAAVDFTATEYDTHGSASLANNRLTAPLDGLYLVIGQVIAGPVAFPAAATVFLNRDASARGLGARDWDVDYINLFTGGAGVGKARLVNTIPMKAGDFVSVNFSAFNQNWGIVVTNPVGQGWNSYLSFQRVGLIPPDAIIY